MADDQSGPIGALPDQPKAAVVAEVMKAGLTTVPIIGGPAAELFGYLMAPSLERRRDEWLNRLAEAVDELRTRFEGFDPQRLRDDEAFISAVVSASTLAMKTHLEEKLAALRNAVMNVALGVGADDETEQMVFLRLVDDLTPLHVQILTLLHNPNEWFEARDLSPPDFAFAGSVAAVIDAGIPDGQGRRELMGNLARDLYNNGLSVAENLTAVGSGRDALAPRTTRMGDRFLAFISNPSSDALADR